jgi:hypothetical protein
LARRTLPRPCYGLGAACALSCGTAKICAKDQRADRLHTINGTIQHSLFRHHPFRPDKCRVTFILNAAAQDHRRIEIQPQPGATASLRGPYRAGGRGLGSMGRPTAIAARA